MGEGRRQEKWIGSEEAGERIVNLGFFCPTLDQNPLIF